MNSQSPGSSFSQPQSNVSPPRLPRNRPSRQSSLNFQIYEDNDEPDAEGDIDPAFQWDPDIMDFVPSTSSPNRDPYSREVTGPVSQTGDSAQAGPSFPQSESVAPQDESSLVQPHGDPPQDENSFPLSENAPPQAMNSPQQSESAPLQSLQPPSTPQQRDHTDTFQTRFGHTSEYGGDMAGHRQVPEMREHSTPTRDILPAGSTSINPNPPSPHLRYEYPPGPTEGGTRLAHRRDLDPEHRYINLTWSEGSGYKAQVHDNGEQNQQDQSAPSASFHNLEVEQKNPTSENALETSGEDVKMDWESTIQESSAGPREELALSSNPSGLRGTNPVVVTPSSTKTDTPPLDHEQTKTSKKPSRPSHSDGKETFSESGPADSSNLSIASKVKKKIANSMAAFGKGLSTKSKVSTSAEEKKNKSEKNKNEDEDNEAEGSDEESSSDSEVDNDGDFDMTGTRKSRAASGRSKGLRARGKKASIPSSGKSKKKATNKEAPAARVTRARSRVASAAGNAAPTANEAVVAEESNIKLGKGTKGNAVAASEPDQATRNAARRSSGATSTATPASQAGSANRAGNRRSSGVGSSATSTPQSGPTTRSRGRASLAASSGTGTPEMYSAPKTRSRGKGSPGT